MINLADVFQLADDRFNQVAASKDFVLIDRVVARLHFAAQFGDQPDALLGKFVQLLRPQNVSAISEDFSLNAFQQSLQKGDGVMDIAWRDLKPEDLAALVDEQVELQSEEPAHRRNAALCKACKGFVAIDSAVVTDGKWRGIDERSAGLSACKHARKNGKMAGAAALQFDKTVVGNKARKLAGQVHEHFLFVEMFERAIVGEVEQNEDCGNLGKGEGRRPCQPMAAAARRERVLALVNIKTLANIIDQAENFGQLSNQHGQAPSEKREMWCFYAF